MRLIVAENIQLPSASSTVLSKRNMIQAIHEIFNFLVVTLNKVKRNS